MQPFLGKTLTVLLRTCLGFMNSNIGVVCLEEVAGMAKNIRDECVDNFSSRMIRQLFTESPKC